LGIGYQVLVVRVLAQVLDNTIYTYALVLLVYLAGTALGAAGIGAFCKWRFGPMLIGLCGLLGASCLLGIVGLGRCGEVMAGLRGVNSGDLGRACAG
jgi:spermidine synthase